MMIYLSVVLAVLSTVTCEESLKRDKRFAIAYAGFPFGPFFGPTDPFPFSYARPGGVYPFGRAGDTRSSSRSEDSASSSRAGAGAGGSYAGGWDYPAAPFYPFPFMPFPVITIPKPWYTGENVCKEVRYANKKQPDEFADWMNGDFPNMFSEYSSEHESCKGSNKVYVCLKSIADTAGQTKIEGTRYECCYGFVRNPSGPGCVESGPQSSTGGSSSSELNKNDKTMHSIRLQGESSIKDKSVSNVPVQ